MAGDEVLDDLELETEALEEVPLVPDQGEDEADPGNNAKTFSASIASRDWTVESLVLQMRKGRIDLEPSFQRRNAWLANRKSKLIESIMLGFPIPQVVLAERIDQPGHFFVLDGKQRLLALRQFFFDPDDERDEGFEPLRLTGLEVMSELNRKNAAGIDKENPEQLAAIENYSMRTVVLSNWNSERLLLSLFLRLNTGSVQLSPQELRQALINGQFIQWLDIESGKLPELRTLLGNQHPDRRMADAELLLRHLAFSTSPVRYRGNLKQFLDDTSRAYNETWSSMKPTAEASLAQFASAITAGTNLMGSASVCRKWSGTKFERALNRAVFDVQIYSLSIPQVRDALEGKGDEVTAAFKRACDTDQAFVRAISTTTKTADAFIARHRTWMRIVEEVGGVDYAIPSPLQRD